MEFESPNDVRSPKMKKIDEDTSENVIDSCYNSD